MAIVIPEADFTPTLGGYTGQGAFRFWCQKVLPIVYDDSLSYYELLNKVVVYLNNVIADVASVEDNVEALNTSYLNLQNFVNETGEAVEGEINQFETSMNESFGTFTDNINSTVTQLQNFVNNYFDNLDVQDEINSKLDAMALDGSLTALLLPLINAEAPGVIADWLNEHITPTIPIVDSSLSVEGAAADAKVTGDLFKKIDGELYGTNQDLMRHNVTSFDLLNNPIENFSTTTSSISEFWGTRYLYRPGYVESVTIYRDKELPNENITVLIADKNFKILWYKTVQNSSQTVTFGVGESFVDDFIVMVRCDGMRYGNAHSDIGGVYWAGMPEEGATITPTAFGTLSFGFTVDYADSFSVIMDALSEANGADFSLIKTNVASYNTTEYPDYKLSSITSSVSEFWGSDYLFNAGMVKSINIKRRKENPYQGVTVILVDENYNILFRSVVNTTEQSVNVPIGYFAKAKFRVAVRCDGMIYGNTGSDYRSFYWSGTPVVGQAIVPTEFGRFSFGVVVEYDDLIESVISQNYGNEYDYMIGTSDFSAYGGNIGSGFWATLNTYPSGYIERLVFNEGASSITCIAVDSIENKILFRGVSDGNVLTVKRMFNNPVFLYLYGSTLKYTVMSGLAGSYANISASVFNALDVGSDYTPSWTAGNYIFAVKAVYKVVISGDLVLKRQDCSRLFVCGDSITAGYPYIAGQPNGINEDIRWGRQVARRLKFDVTFGASSGNGWVYSTGSANAYTITRDTDFSNYDVAIYAWGTNDYGHSSPLGDLSDNPSDVLTVCSRIKWCINKIYTDNPNIVLILVLPINRADVGTKANNYGYGEVNSGGYSLNDLCDKIAELCDEQNIPYIDNRKSAFNRYSLLSLTVDGLHPNYKGYKLLGSRLAGEVSTIISPYFEAGYAENV